MNKTFRDLKEGDELYFFSVHDGRVIELVFKKFDEEDPNILRCVFNKDEDGAEWYNQFSWRVEDLDTRVDGGIEGKTIWDACCELIGLSEQEVIDKFHECEEAFIKDIYKYKFAFTN